MLSLTIHAKETQFGRAVNSHLRKSGFTTTFVVVDTHVAGHHLRAPEATPDADVIQLLEHLMPLAVTVGREPGLDRAALELDVVGWPAGASIRVIAADERRLNAASQLLRMLGANVTGSVSNAAGHTRLDYTGLDQAQVDTLRWVANAAGHRVQARHANQLTRHAAGLYLGPDENGPLVYPTVVVRSDDPHATGQFAAQLGLMGFPNVVTLGPATGVGRNRFCINRPGTLAAEHHPAWAEVATALTTFLGRLGVDGRAMPLQAVPSVARWPELSEPSQIEISLPLQRLRAGTLAPWAGSDKRRYDVVVRGPDDEGAAQVVAALLAEGFQARTEPPLPAAQRPLSSQTTCGELAHNPEMVQELWRVARTALPDLVGDHRGELELSAELALLEKAYLDLERPVSAKDFAARIGHHLGDHKVTFYGASLQVKRQLRKALQPVLGRQLAFIDTDSELPAGRLYFGAGSASAVHALAAEIGRIAGQSLKVNCSSDMTSQEIDVVMPTADGTAELRPEPSPFDRDWGVDQLTDCGFLQLDAAAVRVGTVTLPTVPGPRDPLAPPAAMLEHMCLDAPTRDVLRFAANAVKLGQPCLLEGPTSATKTSGILLLASLLGQPVLRLNLSSQVDTAEMIGQYVPSPTGGFVWQDGAAVRAATLGYWLVLDEVNLGPPQVVERLNSLLETPATLTVAERDHRMIGGGGFPVHPRFRIFATMNPVEYAGRSALSPAGKDRWLHQTVLPPPDVTALRAMLGHATTGEQPPAEQWGPAVVDPAGQQLPRSLPVCPIAAPEQCIEDFLDRLATLHGRVLGTIDADGQTPLGGDRREPYTFTRRGLLALLERVRAEVDGGAKLHDAMRAGLRQVYVDRVAAADHAALAHLMDAVGLGPRCWQVPDAVQFAAGFAFQEAA